MLDVVVDDDGAHAHRRPADARGRPGPRRRWPTAVGLDRRRRRRAARARGRLRPAVRLPRRAARGWSTEAVPDTAALDGARAWARASRCSPGTPPTSTAYARVFAGDLHWDEDPATGSAALGTGVWLVADRAARRRRDVVLRRPAGRAARPAVGARPAPSRRPGGTAPSAHGAAAPSCRSPPGASGCRDRARPPPRPGRCTGPGGRDLALMAVAVVGISLSGPLTALVVAPALAIAFWRNAAGAAALLPVLLTRERAALRRPAPARPAQLAASPGCSSPRTSPPGCPACRMTTVAASIALVTTTPVWTALIARMSGVRLPARGVVGAGARRRRAPR